MPESGCLGALLGHNPKQSPLFVNEDGRVIPSAVAFSSGYYSVTPRIEFLRAYSLPNLQTSIKPAFYNQVATALKDSIRAVLKSEDLAQKITPLVDELYHEVVMLASPGKSPINARFFIIKLKEGTIRGVVSLSHRAATFSLVVLPPGSEKVGFAQVEEFHLILSNEDKEENLTMAHIRGNKTPKGQSIVIHSPDTIAEAFPNANEKFRTQYFGPEDFNAAGNFLGQWFSEPHGEPNTLIIVPKLPGDQFSISRIRAEAGGFSHIIVFPREIIQQMKDMGWFNSIKNSRVFKHLDKRVSMLTKNPDGAVGISDVTEEYRTQNPQRPKDIWPVAMGQGVAANRVPNFNLPIFSETTISLLELQLKTFRNLNETPVVPLAPMPIAESEPAVEPTATPTPPPAPTATAIEAHPATGNAELTATIEKLSAQIAAMAKDKDAVESDLAVLRADLQTKAENIGIDLASDIVAALNQQVEYLTQEKQELARTIETLRAQVKGLRAHKQGIDPDEAIELRRLMRNGSLEDLKDALRYHEILAAGRLIVHEHARKRATHAKQSDDPEVIRLMYKGLRVIYEDVIPVMEQNNGQGLQGVEETVRARSAVEVSFKERHATMTNASAQRSRAYKYVDPVTHEVFEGHAWYHVILGHRLRIYFDIIQDSTGTRRAIIFSLPEHFLD